MSQPRLTARDVEHIFVGLSDGDLAELIRLGVSFDNEAGSLQLPDDILKLSQEALWRRCAQDEEFFILDSGLVRTLDRQEKWDCHDCHGIVASKKKRCSQCGSPNVTRRDPCQPFPPLDYLRDIVRVYQTERKIALAKSRRMLATEITSAHILYGCLFREGFFAIIQADREDKADENVQRVYGMWSRLPQWIKQRRPANPRRALQSVRLDFHMPSNKARVLGLPSGAEQIRMYGPTCYWCDEIAFIPEAMETYGAVMPAVEVGCQFIATSTAAAGFFDGLCNDILEQVA